MRETISAKIRRRAVLAAGAVTIAFAASAGVAGAQNSDVPSYASGEESIRGRIASIDDKYHLQVRDERGFVDSVTLHDGTVINPTGLRLSPGQSVTVLGHNAGKTFEANEIDTPYGRYGGYAYAYPAYGYPAYGYRVYPYAGYRWRPYGYGYPAFGFGYRGPGFAARGWF